MSINEAAKSELWFTLRSVQLFKVNVAQQSNICFTYVANHCGLRIRISVNVIDPLCYFLLKPFSFLTKRLETALLTPRRVTGLCFGTVVLSSIHWLIEADRSEARCRFLLLELSSQHRAHI